MPAGLKPKVKVLIVSVAVTGCLLCAVVAFSFWLLSRVLDLWSGRPHTFELAEAPSFLREETALEMARRTLPLDGYDAAIWEPIEDRRTTSRDGVRDKYLCRNTIDPRRGYIELQKQGSRETILINIEVVGKRVETRISRPK